MKKNVFFSKCFAMLVLLGIAAVFGMSLSAAFNMSEPALKVASAGSNRYYVMFKNQPTQSDENMIAGKGAVIRHRFTLVTAFSVTVPNDSVLNSIKSDSNVDYVEKVSVVRALGDRIPWGIEAIKAPLVWDTVTGDGIKVCVVDTGIDYNHPDLDDNYGGGYDFVNDDDDPWDDNGHGTHCSGIIAAEANGMGIVGAAFDVDVYACKVLNEYGVGYTDDVLAGVGWAVNNGMGIVSMSLGGGNYSPFEEAFYQSAYDAGLLIVCAAGGSGADIAYPAKYGSTIAVGAVDRNLEIAPFSAHGPEMELVAPGILVESTVPVGTGFESYVSQGSTYYEAIGMSYAGLTAGITATLYYCGLGETPEDFPPGVNGNIALIQRGNISFAEKTTNAMNAGAVAVIIYNNVPGLFMGTLGTPGSWVPVVSMSYEDGETLRNLGTPTVTLVNDIGDYEYYSGTSMACPHVAGVAALVMQANDELTNVEVRDIMNSTATDLGDPGWDEYYGYGLVNAQTAVEEATTPEVFLFISSIRMELNWLDERRVQALAHVKVMDTSGRPVAGAVVYGEWSGCVQGEVGVKTGNDGVAILKSPIFDLAAHITPERPCFIIKISDIVHSTIPYAPELNKVPPHGRICI